MVLFLCYNKLKFENKHLFGGDIILNEAQQKILDLLREDPYLSQQEIANKVGLSRPSIANHISQLIDIGYIVGKAYVLSEPKEDLIICIGASNIDQKYTAYQDIVFETSNPVSGSTSIGGVIRNIAENLGRLNQSVSLISLVGDDIGGQHLVDEMKSLVNTDQIEKISNQNTGTYTAILNPNGDLVCGLADMEICQLMTKKWVAKYEKYLSQAKMIIVDTNVQADCIDYLIQFCQTHQLPLFIVGVSTIKMSHLPKHQLQIECGIFNLDEAQTYFNSKASPKTLVKKWLEIGLKHVIITQGTKDVVYGHQESITSIPIYKTENVVDVTGAGDSFIAGLIYGLNQNKDYISSIHYGLVNSHHTVLSTDSVRTNLSSQSLEKEMEHYKNESISRN